MRATARKMTRSTPVLVSRGESDRALRPFTTHEYMRMAELGILDPEEKVELLDGKIYEMSPQGNLHAAIVSLLVQLLGRAFGRGHVVFGQATFQLPPKSAPEPDVWVMAGKHEDYVRGRPYEPLLVVEVAVTSQRRDRAKARIYARANVPEYWLVDLEKNVLEVRRKPSRGNYGETRNLAKGTIKPLFTKRAVSVAKIFAR